MGEDKGRQVAYNRLTTVLMCLFCFYVMHIHCVSGSTDDEVQSLRPVDGLSTVGGSSTSTLTASTLTSLPDPSTTYLIR